MAKARIGVIGGSGLYEIEGLTDVEEVKVKTPFGEPSDLIVIGTLEGRRVAFLPRHGRGHRIMPTELPSRANMYALKSLGVEHIIAVSACGSLKEEIRPLDMVIPDQIFDRTRGRINTFFGGGVVAHISFDEPFCPDLSALLYQAARDTGAKVHKGGTFVVMEGPAFSTKAESRIYRQWGMDIIGMTVLPEAKLAREAEICYAVLANVTDYDVWHVGEEPVSVEMVIDNLVKNVKRAKKIIKKVVPNIPEARTCPCPTALQSAIITSKDRIPEKAKKDLGLLIGKYLEE
ncbi:MAG TPA: S-methyl-5'-thioadenosine phosphorylase [Chloroflexi bacterium]|nr:S-methyl-5'-thioadenosine phosphorylase [Chloroflexota bacterium]